MRCSPVRAALALGLLSCAGGTAVAQDLTRIYSNGFENQGPGAEWSVRNKVESHSRLSKFMGRFSNETVRLTLDAVQPPPPPDGGGGGPDGGGGGGGPDGGGGGGGGGPFVGGFPARPGRPNSASRPRVDDPIVRYKLTFDLILIDSWDGADPVYGSDTFGINVNGETFFLEAFDNHHPWDNFRMPDLGPVDLGYATWKDSVYREIEVWFDVDPSATQLQIDFIGSLNQAISDESWGIDRVRVDYMITTIPSPGVLGSFAFGAGALGVRRRRRH